MKKIAFILGLLAAFAIIPTAHAWYNDTHAVMMWKVCQDFKCPLSYKDVFEWSNYPDDVLKDNNLHFCIWKDCPAQVMYNARLRKASLLNDSQDIWREISIASHYYFDAKNIMHQVPPETINWNHCHNEFESQTNEFIKKKQTNWVVEVEVCQINTTDAELTEFVLDYEEYLESFLDVEKIKDVNLIQCNFWCELMKKIRKLFS